MPGLMDCRKEYGQPFKGLNINGNVNDCVTKSKFSVAILAQDCKEKDIGLAEFGRKVLTFAEHEMPGLMDCRNPPCGVFGRFGNVVSS